jgi:flagellar hook-associated protein 2
MSNAGISFGGLASGLDTRSIIAALMAVERRPIAALEVKKGRIQRQKDLFGTLGGLLTTLRDKANALRSTTSLLAMKAGVDTDQYLTASAGSGAQPSSHQVRVLSLAQAQVNSSNGKADRDTTTYGDGKLRITIDGTDHSIDVGGTTGFASTLDGIAQAINAQGLDVVAEVLDTGAATDPFQLVLRSRNTGSAGSFTVAVDSGPASLQALAAEIDANVRTAASNAQIDLNGITITRSANTISDAITGVTLDLRAVNPVGTATTVTVSTDAPATAGKIKQFVDAYNAVVDFLQDQNKVDSKGTANGPLFGDSTLRSIGSSLRSILGSPANTGNTAYELLSQVGIAAATNGRLTFDQARFETALAADPDAVTRLFNDATTGIAARVHDQAKVYLDSVDGLLKARRDGFDSLTRQTQNRIDAAERRLQQYQKQIERRFAALEGLLAQLQGQGNALGSLGFSRT